MPLAQYKAQIEKYTIALASVKKKSKLFSAIRLVLVLGILGTVYGSIKNEDFSFLGISILLIIVFVWVLFRHLDIQKHKGKVERIIKINQEEIAYLKGDYKHFDGGQMFVNPKHLFSSDLDLFGENSLFQHINRTVTFGGKKNLAKRFVGQDARDIDKHQEAIKELTPLVDWRQNFAAAGKGVKEDEHLYKRLENWLAKHSKTSFLLNNILLYPLAALCVGLLIYFFWSPTVQSFKWFSYAMGFNLLLVFFQFNRIKKEYELLNGVSASLNLYKSLLTDIENTGFKAPLLKEIQAKMMVGTTSPSQTLKSLTRLLDNFDQLNNAVALIFTNGIYHNHLHVLKRLYKWKDDYGSQIYTWLEGVSQFDALLSLANFSFNKTEFNYPTLLTTPQMKAVNMGHPLIDKAKRVNNDINFDGYKYVILTGSNMSGKSTFLRTLGVNMVLAKMGAPVCATHFSTYPFQLLTSMKQVDSLADDASYFKAEIVRLKEIQQEMLADKYSFVLLDEILRGTNSEDKRKGTRLFMEKIAHYNALGVIATHDIDIAELAENKANVYRANYFESKVEGDKLLFDYKLREGVCTTPNATDLMRAHGII